MKDNIVFEKCYGTVPKKLASFRGKALSFLGTVPWVLFYLEVGFCVIVTSMQFF